MDAIQSEPTLEGGRKPKILIVEDERIVAEELERRITRFGYDITATVSSARKRYAPLRNVARVWS